MSELIKIKYFSDDLTRIAPIPGGDWLDLRCSETIELEANTFYLIPLGVAMQLPEGYEAHVAPRSSTFKNYGIIQVNSVGVIDNAYSGNNDMWKMPVYTTCNTVINKNDRIAQFRIIQKQPPVTLIEVESLHGKDRGGFGSSGVK